MAVQGPLGWIDDPGAVDAATTRMTANGVMTATGAERGLTGYARERIALGFHHSLAQTHEAKLGQSMPAYHQKRGTCVDQGSTRAVQDSYFAAIARNQLVSAVVRIAVGPTYALARKASGRGKSFSNRTDGLAGAEWAEQAAMRGVWVARKTNGVDLAKDQEQHAIDWTNNGVPSAILSDGIRVKAHKVRTVEELADCLFAGYYAAQCSGSYFEGMGRKPFAKRLSLNGGGHCEEICGAFFDGKDIHSVRQQSWGDKAPSPSPWSITVDGEAIQLRPGSYPVHCDDMHELIRQGEVWCFQPLVGVSQ